MRCCVPYCENTSTNVSTSESKGISFHGLPSDVRLRAAWLRALGKQHSQLPDSAVVCSQHFLNDEIYETESGLRQIATGAVPSTVQVCMICLDTDSKLYPMSKHKLEEAYEMLTGYPLYDQGNLKQTLCVQCAQRLLNFSRFRDKSLRARALMMDLVEKHELITRQHIKMINLTKNQLNSDLVVTTLGPDHCDLYILDSSDKQTESEPIQYISVVKNEESYDSPVDEDMEVAEEDDNTADNVNEEFLSESEIIMEAKQLAEMPDPLKYETTAFLYSPCSEEFVSEHAYMQHMRMHDQKVCGNADCGTSQVCKPHTAVSSLHSPHLTENKQTIPLSQAPSPSAHSPQTAVAPLYARLATSNGNNVQAEDADTVQKSKLFKINNAELHKNYYTEGSLPIEKNWYTCDVCRNTYDRKSLLVKHIKTHTDIKPFTCNICPFKTKYKYSLTTHMRTHTGEKLFTCKLCDYQCAFNSNFVLHMRTHTGEKPYTCKLCEYKFARNYDLIRHMKSHTGEKPFNCELCEYKFSDKRNLVNHMRRTHTGEKSVSCTLCEYKCASNSNLVHHMKTHSASRSYTCKMCNYICARSNHLVAHMRTHTGEKPYACNVCEYKCAQNSNLLSHMRTHTRDKPVSCELCKYKCADERTLVRHMRTHTRGKCFACELCDYKCASSSNFVFHMRTHTGEKPYTCNLCEYKFARNCDLIRHMRTHTGEKPYSCELCKFKCVDKRNLVSHVRRTHTGEKPFGCDLCEIKFAYKYQLVTHMGSHTGERPGVDLKRSGVETCSAGQSDY